MQGNDPTPRLRGNDVIVHADNLEKLLRIAPIEMSECQSQWEGEAEDPPLRDS